MPDYRAAARHAAQRNGLDPDIFERQIQQESGFDPTIRSPAGALGIAQIMPATARGWGVDPMNPVAALNAAAKNMANYVRQYGGYENALRAYNAGPGAIERSKGFAETNHYVRTILGGRSAPARTTAQPAGRGAQPRGRNTTTNTTTTVTPGVDNRVARAQLIQAFLSQKGADPVAFALRARELADVAPTSSSVTERSSSGGGGARTPGDGGGRTSGGGSALASFATNRANVIDRQRLPYSWGGGHAGQTKIHDPVPLDCSGAVAKVLGIDPRVSGQFRTWGRPGAGGGKGVTVYANDKHVLMSINGHFFGTSASNPGGGAGWIPQAQISPAYLKNFTARHSR